MAGKALLLIRSLNAGGTERQLIYLARGLRLLGYDTHVAVFYRGGRWEDAFRDDPKMRFHYLEKSGRWDIFSFISQFRNLVRDREFDVIYGFLPAANLVALLAKWFCRSKPPRVVWGVRVSQTNYPIYGYFDVFLGWFERRALGFADRVISNSRRGIEMYASNGFKKEKFICIPNGIDTVLYDRNQSERIRIRASLGIPPNGFLIGVVARLDPMKGHVTFLRAAALLAERGIEARFACIGGEAVPNCSVELKRLTSELGLAQRVYWAGYQQDVVSWINALDICCSSSSFGEGFSNSIGEAMACGVPCVVTDIGDSAWIVGETGKIVPPENPEALAGAWSQLLAMSQDERRLLGRKARSRILEHFSIDNMVRKTDSVLQGLMG